MVSEGLKMFGSVSVVGYLPKGQSEELGQWLESKNKQQNQQEEELEQEV